MFQMLTHDMLSVRALDRVLLFLLQPSDRSNFLFSGEYSCLSVDLVFKRQFSYYLITIYVPGCMLVIVSWVSFWLDPHAVPARVALGVTTLLTMSTQTASINSALPPVAYTKAIDVWQVSTTRPQGFEICPRN